MKGLLTAVSLAALLAAAPAWAQSVSNSQALSSQDRTFLSKAGAGNRAEVQLGRLAEQQAGAPAVKEFGRWMATDHSLANRRLAAIARYLGHPIHPQLTQQDISLKNTLQGLHGTQFDTRYTQAMVEDHQKDIRAFQQEAQNGQARPLKMYAHTMLPVLDQHLAEARQLAGNNGAAMGAAARSTTGSGSSVPRGNR